VLASHDPELGAKLGGQLAKLAEVQARYDAAWGTKPAQAAQWEEQIQREQAVVDRLSDQYMRLTLRSQAHGTLLLDRPDDLPGRYLKRGEIVGYVVGEHLPLVRIVVRQEDVDRVRLASRKVEVKLADDLSVTWIATVLREVPAAGKELPSPALGQRGGGEIVLDPSDKDGVKTMQSLFEFELELPKEAPGKYLGSRVLARFEHEPTPIGVRGWHLVRQLFLSQFHV
jgi:putative peptide zinc metalloprotease protein